MSDKLATAAAWYAKRLHWPIFPLKPRTKQPATRHGFKDATADADQVASWWTQTPNANIGMATGAVLVIDFDTYKPDFDGDALLEFLEQECTTVRADAHGAQLFYVQPAGLPPIRNGAGDLPAGVDVRGAGGYTVLAPSLHPEGYVYKWAQGRSPADMTPAPLPLFVADLILRRDSRQHRSTPKDGDTTIADFNRQHRIADLLVAHGYTLAARQHGGFTRLARPGRDERQTSVVITTIGGVERSYHHSTSDPLHTDGFARDAFDVFTMLEHNNDAKAAYRAAKRLLGTWQDEPHAPPLEVAEDDQDGDQDDDQDEQDALPHPLRDVEPVNLAALAPRLGWLHDFAEYAAQLGGAPYEFGLATALTALAAAVGGNARIEYPITIRPNLYAAIVAPSSVFRKSTTIGAVYDLYRTAEIDAVIGTSITGEALIEQLAERAKVKDDAGNVTGQQPAAGLLVQMELRDVLRSDLVKYSTLLKNTLTELFDGYPLRRRLRSGTHEFQESALTIVGATVPDTIFEDMGDEDWRSGFGARWLFVTTKQEPDFETPLPETDPQALATERRQRLAHLAELPRLLYTMPATVMTLTPAALRLWDTHRRSTEKAAHQYDNDVLRYTVTRLNAAALKLAMLVNLSCSTVGDWTTIDTYTMTTALRLIDFFKTCLADLLDTRDRKAKHTGALQGMLIRVARMNKKGEQPTTRDLVRNTKGMNTDLANSLLDELYRRGAVIRSTGRHPRYTAVYEKLPVGK